MKRNRNNFKKVISLVLAAVMLCGCTGALAYAAGAKNSNSVSSQTVETSKAAAATSKAAENNKSTESAENAENSKDEAVYVIADANGSAQKIIVSDWIKNAIGESSITDDTSLENIINTKDDTGYTMNSDNVRVWDAGGNDIYYQGNIEKELPVEVAVSYRLDGKTVSAEELAGKSGKVTIRFDYTNKQYEEVVIDGVKTKIFVPFVMLSGMVLDNKQFTNVQVTNGKIVNDGDKTVVLGIALPGMQENLAMDSDTFDIPDYVEINADVTEFEITTTLTLATNEVFNDINLEDADSIDSLDDLSASMDKLSDAMSSLLDGSSALYDGLSTLLEQSGKLVDGIDQLSAGAGQLRDGTGSLESGVTQLQTGIETLSGGLNKLTSNNDSLNKGAQQVFESLLAEAGSQLAKSGLSVEKLTIDNYASVLNGVLDSLSETSVHDMAYSKALDTVTSAVEAQKSVVREKVEAAVYAKVLEGVLKAAGQNMTAEEFQAAVAAGKISSEMQAKMTAVVDTQMKSAEIQKQIDTNTEAKLQSLIDQNMQSSEVASKIKEAVESAKSGTDSISALKGQLDSYNKFYVGLLVYTDGVEKAGNGAEKLTGGSEKLAKGASTLSSGADSLYSGLNTLKDKSTALIDGISQLKDGSMQLSDGLKEFNEEGIQKLTDAMDGNVDGFISRLRATIDVSKNYKSFAGKSDAMDGSVKFIYKTASIEK